VHCIDPIACSFFSGLIPDKGHMVVFSGSCMPFFSFFIFSSVPFSFFFPESRAQSYGYFPIPPKITLQSYVKFR